MPLPQTAHALACTCSLGGGGPAVDHRHLPGRLPRPAPQDPPLVPAYRVVRSSGLVASLPCATHPALASLSFGCQPASQPLACARCALLHPALAAALPGCRRFFATEATLPHSAPSVHASGVWASRLELLMKSKVPTLIWCAFGCRSCCYGPCPLCALLVSPTVLPCLHCARPNPLCVNLSANGTNLTSLEWVVPFPVVLVVVTE